MQLQAIRVYSAQSACRVDAGKFTRFYRYTTGNACKLRVEPFYMQFAGKVTCILGNFARVSFTVCCI